VLLALGLLAAELALRGMGSRVAKGPATGELQKAFAAAGLLRTDPRPGLHYSNSPKRRVELSGRRTTHDGRGRRVTPGPFAQDAPAVVFLGDSTTYGLGVEDHETLPAQVAALLDGAIRPLNLGVPGYNTAQELALYRSEREQLDDAPLVVLLYFPNDSIDAWFWDEAHGVLYYDGLPLPAALKRSLRKSALYRAVASAHARSQKAAGRLESERPQNMDKSMAALAQLAQACRDDGRQLLVAHLPAFVSLDPYLGAGQVARLEAQCRELGLPFIDLLDAYLAEREATLAAKARRRKPIPDSARRHYLERFWVLEGVDSHPNVEGYGIAAEALARAVAQQLGG